MSGGGREGAEDRGGVVSGCGGRSARLLQQSQKQEVPTEEVRGDLISEGAVRERGSHRETERKGAIMIAFKDDLFGT